MEQVFPCEERVQSHSERLLSDYNRRLSYYFDLCYSGERDREVLFQRVISNQRLLPLREVRAAMMPVALLF
jgi:hypothetical protein